MTKNVDWILHFVLPSIGSHLMGYKARIISQIWSYSAYGLHSLLHLFQPLRLEECHKREGKKILTNKYQKVFCESLSEKWLHKQDQNNAMQFYTLLHRQS